MLATSNADVATSWQSDCWAAYDRDDHGNMVAPAPFQCLSRRHVDNGNQGAAVEGDLYVML